MTTSVKTCFKCGAVKPLTEFYRHPQMADGHVNKCKVCNKEDVRRNRRKRVEYYREYDRERGSRHRPGYIDEYWARNPDRRQANTALGNAVRDGRVIKWPCCQHCGETESIVAHHPDYSMPLVVTWLCQGCHRQLHWDFERAQAGENPFA